MKTIPVLLPDDLHKQFRIKLYQEDRTSKEFFLTSVRVYVDADPGGQIKEDEKPEDPAPAIEVHTLDPPIEPESKDKKPKEKIDDEKRKPKTGGDNPGGEGEDRKKEPSAVPGEKEGGGPGEPGPRKKGRTRPWYR